MKVYVVLQITNYSSNEFCGVFRTWDKAHLKIKDIIVLFLFCLSLSSAPIKIHFYRLK